MKTKTTELYTLKCRDCQKVFKTDKPLADYCPDCIDYRKPRKGGRKKKEPKKILTFAEILHIADVYSKINHKYLHYGDIVALLERNENRCVCCGASIPEGRQICLKCEKAVE